MPPIIFTDHAVDRIREFGLTVNDARVMYYESQEEKLPKGMKEHKHRKYGGSQYRRYGSYIFTLVPKRHAVLCVTFTDQRIMLP